MTPRNARGGECRQEGSVIRARKVRSCWGWKLFAKTDAYVWLCDSDDWALLRGIHKVWYPLQQRLFSSSNDLLLAVSHSSRCLGRVTVTVPCGTWCGEYMCVATCGCTYRLSEVGCLPIDYLRIAIGQEEMALLSRLLSLDYWRRLIDG
jgi:hypothetical protein